MSQKHLIFIGLILSACIIGFFVYLGIMNRPLLEAFQVSENLYQKNNQVQPKQGEADFPIKKCQAGQNTIVTKVIDGDTVVVQGGEHVRLLGMDADEQGYACYQAAKTRLEALVLGKEVVLQKDVTDVDKYDRCLRTVFVGTENINLQLVGEGLAVARFYPPDVKYKSEITAAEKQAIQNNTGCKWKK